MFEKFTQQLVSLLVAKNSNESFSSNNGGSSLKRNCHFCGSVSHLLPVCDIVEQTIKEGKCIRNHVGRLVLPGGGYLPRSINGKTMLDRFKIQDSLPRKFYLLAQLQACYMTVFRVQCHLTLHDTLLGHLG